MKSGFVKCHQVLVGLLIATLSCISYAKDGYSPPVSMQKNISTYTVRNDGSYQKLTETSMRIENEAGVSAFAENKLPYTPKYESLKILNAYTLLPNGTRLKVPARNVRDAKGDMDDQETSFSDTQYKVVIYPNVVVGSQLYLKYVLVRHTALFPGQFTLRETISPYVKYANEEVNIDFDPRIDIKIDSKGFDGGKLPDRNGLHRYHFSYKQDKFLPYDSDQIDSNDYSPYVVASSFASYEALGAAYQEKARHKVRVMPAIQKLADNLTLGVKDKRQQIRLLYDWVSKNIRYVGSYIGNGAFIPHDSQTILDNKWGDCKDHVVILEALLAAKGINSSPALINSNDSYALPKLAVIDVFDHLITYVPSFNLYLDSTAQFAPFGTLPRPDLNKSVVLTGLNKVGKTPPMLASENVIKSSIFLKVLPDGTIQGSSQAIASGVTGIDFRGKEFEDQATPQDQVVTKRLSRANLSGIGQIHSTDPSDLDKPLELKTTFTLDPVSNIPGPAAMPIPAGLSFGIINGKFMDKPKEKIDLPQGCDSSTFINHYEIEFPSNIKVTHIPANVKYRDDATQYTATYEIEGNKLEVSRELITQYPTMICGNAENELDKKFFPVFQRDMRAQVIYE